MGAYNVIFTQHDMRQMTPPRKLMGDERAIFYFLLRKTFPGRESLRQQVEVASVTDYCVHCPTITLVTDTSVCFPAEVLAVVPIEAEGVQDDGMRFHILLHVQRGFLSKLEFYREDGASIPEIPKPQALELDYWYDEEGRNWSLT